MTINASDIAREHQEAIASLTPQQRHAINRLREAKQRTHFNGRFIDENLKALFEAEAASRTRTQDEALFEAALAASDALAPLEAERRRLEAALGRGFPIAA